MTEIGPEEDGWRPWVIWTICIIVVLLTAFIVSCAHARDPDGIYANSPLHDWFNGLRSGKGLCCSFADRTSIADADWRAKDGHYQVRLDVSTEVGKTDMQWIDVPDDAVITEPNKVGRTMVWPVRGYQGVSIRCFMPGSMT